MGTDQFPRDTSIVDYRTRGLYNFVWRNSSVKKEFDVVIERDCSGYFVASIPALPGCHTQAKTLDKLMERIREAAELWLEVHGDNVEQLEFVGLQKISVPA